MIPHEHAPLTARELTVLAELEHDLADIPLPSEAPEPTSSWPHQLAGVIVVAVSTLLLAGLVHPGEASALIVVEAAVGVLGLAAGAIIAIDPARRFVRSTPTRGARAGRTCDGAWSSGVRPAAAWRSDAHGCSVDGDDAAHAHVTV